MIVFTGGQSFDDVAEMVTLDRAYGIAVARDNNMAGEDITGRKFRLVIPDAWARVEFAGRTVTLPAVSGGISSKVILAAAAAFVVMSVVK